MRHRTVDLDGPVHYLDFGGAGPPLVMVHGLGGSAINWMAVGAEMAKDYRAVALDLAGFGTRRSFVAPPRLAPTSSSFTHSSRR